MWSDLSHFGMPNAHAICAYVVSQGMKVKCSAVELRRQALQCRLAPCEMRAFAALHEGKLSACNHIDFVEAFVLHLGSAIQHTQILSVLSSCARDFKGCRISYKPPGGTVMMSVLDVARWVGSTLDGGLAHSKVSSLMNSPLPIEVTPHHLAHCQHALLCGCSSWSAPYVSMRAAAALKCRHWGRESVLAILP